MSERYSIRVTHSAEKELRQLDRSIQQRVSSVIESLREEPRPHGCIKLAGEGNLWRVRIGDYRVVYTIDDASRLVRIIVVRHRSKAYE